MIKYVNLTIAEDLHRALKLECVATGRTMSEIAREALTEYLRAAAEERANVNGMRS